MNQPNAKKGIPKEGPSQPGAHGELTSFQGIKIFGMLHIKDNELNLIVVYQYSIHKRAA